MIATEGRRRGINLQFCSLVVNYDLRGTRSGSSSASAAATATTEAHVVVVNFLNRNNEATSASTSCSPRSFQLFEGFFGASDEVLAQSSRASISSGASTRSTSAAARTEEIKSRLHQLSSNSPSKSTRHEPGAPQAARTLRRRGTREAPRARRGLEGRTRRFEQLLMQLTQHELVDCAEFQVIRRSV